MKYEADVYTVYTFFQNDRESWAANREIYRLHPHHYRYNNHNNNYRYH